MTLDGVSFFSSDVVEVFGLAHQDVDTGINSHAFNGCGVGATLVDGDLLGHIMQVDSLFKAVKMTAGIRRTRIGDLLGLSVFLALCLAISAIGGWVTAGSVDTWYRTLNKPDFNPPDWVFAPVWILLYFMIALAGWRVWRRAGLAGARAEMAVYAVQLALNLGWSFLFFGGRMIGIALAEIVLLLAMICVNALLFSHTDKMAGWLLAPYAAWVAFACVLNYALWMLN